MRVLALIVALSVVGCVKPAHSQGDVDRGRAAVVAVLDNWKANEPIAKLKASASSVEFIEALRTTQTLTEYGVVRVDPADPAVIRVTVTLKLKDKKGKATEREAVYSVALRTPIVVARDPYY